MKTFIGTFLIIFALYLGLALPHLNQSKKLIQKLVASKPVTFPFLKTRDQLLLKTELIKQRQPDCLILGSSRSQTIDPRNLELLNDCSSPFNASIWGGNYFTAETLSLTLQSMSFKKILWVWNAPENASLKYGKQFEIPPTLNVGSIASWKKNFDYWSKKIFDFYFFKELTENLRVARLEIQDEKSLMSPFGFVTYSQKILDTYVKNREYFYKYVVNDSLVATLPTPFENWCEIFDRFHGKITFVTMANEDRILKRKFSEYQATVAKTCDIEFVEIFPETDCDKTDKIDDFHYRAKCMEKIINHKVRS